VHVHVHVHVHGMRMCMCMACACVRACRCAAGGSRSMGSCCDSGRGWRIRWLRCTAHAHVHTHLHVPLGLRMRAGGAAALRHHIRGDTWEARGHLLRQLPGSAARGAIVSIAIVSTAIVSTAIGSRSYSYSESSFSEYIRSCNTRHAICPGAQVAQAEANLCAATGPLGAERAPWLPLR
jgi:hypothetical protein